MHLFIKTQCTFTTGDATQHNNHKLEFLRAQISVASSYCPIYPQTTLATSSASVCTSNLYYIQERQNEMQIVLICNAYLQVRGCNEVCFLIRKVDMQLQILTESLSAIHVDVMNVPNLECTAVCSVGQKQKLQAGGLLLLLSQASPIPLHCTVHCIVPHCITSSARLLLLLSAASGHRLILSLGGANTKVELLRQANL